VNLDAARPIEYVLTGFKQELDIRRFAFVGIDGDRTRTKFTVAVDISLIRKYAISLQELPLLCRHLLEVQAAAAPGRALTFTEADMIGHADRRAAAELAAEQRKVHRKFPSNHAGEAWRQSSPFSRKPD
jgi:hypothetical protein